MYIREGGQWHYSEPRVKAEGEWRDFLTVYEKFDGGWRIISDNATWSLFALQWEDDFFWEGI